MQEYTHGVHPTSYTTIMAPLLLPTPLSTSHHPLKHITHHTSHNPLSRINANSIIGNTNRLGDTARAYIKKHTSKRMISHTVLTETAPKHIQGGSPINESLLPSMDPYGPLLSHTETTTGREPSVLEQKRTKRTSHCPHNSLSTHKGLRPKGLRPPNPLNPLNPRWSHESSS